jgi:cytochrome c peroxidase
MQTKRIGLFCFLALLLLAACGREPAPPPGPPTVRVVAEGLLGPIGLAALPDGGLLIAEEGTGQNDESAGVSLLTADGEIGRFISGLPSRRDAGDLAGVNFVTLTPDGRFLTIGNFGQGHLWQWTLPEGPLALPPTPLTTADLTPVMLPLNNVRLTNPFALTFDREGVPVVSDASGNGVATLNPDGTTRFIHRFAPLTDPANAQLTIDPVPTGIARVGAEYYVTLLGGCPYPANSGLLVAIDTQRNQRTILDGLNMPIDVAVAPDGTIWLLEFARFTAGASCFTGEGYQQHTGRLSRLTADGGLELALDGLNFPGAVLPMPDGSLYLTEVFHGRVLHVTFDPSGQAAAPETPAAPLAHAAPVYREIADVDAALTAVIQAHTLRPNPGEEQRAADSPLAELGRDLFFDPILSGDLNISCATCHHPDLSMGDGRVLPIGTGGDGLGPVRDFMDHVTLADEASMPRLLRSRADATGGDPTVANPFLGAFVPRNSPTILNSALLPVQFWDGRVKGYGLETAVVTPERAVNQLGLSDPLTVQALFPVTSLHEMAGATLGHLPPADIRRQLARRLSRQPAYAERFAAVFGAEEATPLQIVLALAEFERRFIFTNAPWDDYLGGNRTALTDQQKRGALLFFGELNPQVNCAQCHSGDLFTDLDFHNILAPQLGPGKGHGGSGREDWGRAGVTFDLRDQYKFRTPSLRNVALTAPYLHSGAYATLEDVIWHHANVWEHAANYDPGRHLPPSFYSSVRPFDPLKQGRTVAPALRDGLPLSSQDVADLVAFLHSLTDPAAADLAQFAPDSVPSGLPLDPPLPPEAVTVDRPVVPTPAASVAAGGATTPGELRFRDVAPSVG